MWETFRFASTYTKEKWWKIAASAKVTHFPTGICVEVDDSLSMYKNREKALGILELKIKEYVVK